MVDDDIASIFAAVAQDIEPDLAAVVAEATRRGRIRRARRRLAIACTASASVVAVAVAATVAAHLASARVHGSPPAGPGGHRHAHVRKPKAHHTRRAVPQAHGPGMTRSQMLAALRPMLPANWAVTYVSPSTTRGSLEVNFNDGKGAADILLSIWPTIKPQDEKGFSRLSPSAQREEIRTQENYCPSPLWKDEGSRPAGALPISCVRRVLPDGSAEEDAVTYADVASYYVYMIYENRPDGITVSINVGNGTLDGTPHLARAGWPYVDLARPPGTMALWSKIVESPKWHL